MPKLYWEDFTQGQVAVYGPRTVTRSEIVAFAAEFDPQPFHLDEDAARSSILGALSASGWHTIGIMMRLICDGFLVESSSMGSPGIDQVKWLKPVFPGDRLSARCTVEGTRASQSKPDRGFVTFLIELINQHGEPVMNLKTPIMFVRREAAAP